VRKLFQGNNLYVTIGVVAALLASVFFIRVPLPAILLPAEKLGSVAGFPITNTLITTLIADLTVLAIAIGATYKMKDVPSGLQNLVEWFFESFEGMLTDIAGQKNARRWFPMFMTILLFLLFANWWELVPGFDSVGYLEPVEIAYLNSDGTINTGYEKTVLFGVVPSLSKNQVILTEEDKAEIKAEAFRAEEEGHEYHPEHPRGYVLTPFLRVATSDLNLPLALALISVFWTQVVGIRALGWKYFRRFFMPVITGIKPIDFFVGILELVSEFAKIISFSFRLFGNIFAGQVLLFIMPFLVALLIPLPIYGLELFVGFMQAFVFAILTFIFMSQAIHSHAGDEAH